jgi:predicted dehydrogenase
VNREWAGNDSANCEIDHRDWELRGISITFPSRHADVSRLTRKWYPTSTELLADPAIDAVFVATTNIARVLITLAALAPAIT